MANDFVFTTLPEELWLNIFKFFHPIYDDIFTLSRVCKQWRNIIIKQPDPSLWEIIELANTRNCYLDSPFLNRFNFILKKFGRCIKVLKLRRCHGYFSDVLKTYSKLLCSLQVLEITGMAWSKGILQELPCFKALRYIKVESSNDDQAEGFNEEDLVNLVENFTNLDGICLQYSVVNSNLLSQIQDIVASQYNWRITELQIERAKLEALELADIVQNLSELRHFSYGNDQTYGLPSIQELHLMSKSMKELDLFQIGDFSEFCLNLPHLQRLSISYATSLKKLSVYAPSLRALKLNHCPELRKISKISSNSLNDLTVRKCIQLNWSDLIRFFVRNSDIKMLKMEVNVVNLRLDQNTNPSLERLDVLDSGNSLTYLDIRCPKLKVLTFKKSLMQSSMLKMVSIRADEMDDVVIKDVPHFRKAILNIKTIKYLEFDFDRRFHQVKPLHFTTINFQQGSCIQKLVLKKFNLRSMTTSYCNVAEVVLDSCNLDTNLNTVLEQFCDVEALTLQNSYGPCQIMVQNDTLRKLRVWSCSSVLMDHIDILCPYLERLDIHGSLILPSKKELAIIANELKRVCPQLVDVNFSH